MRVAAFAGPSNSGKTTSICELIRHFVARGETVAAIKHTHHPLTGQRGGDTEKFENAGASTVILAGVNQAVVFGRDVRRITFQSPTDLLAHTNADIVLVEGFKDFHGWPRVASIEEAIALLDRID